MKTKTTVKIKQTRKEIEKVVRDWGVCAGDVDKMIDGIMDIHKTALLQSRKEV